MDKSAPIIPGDSELTDLRPRIALRAALAMLVPLARWLVRNGVHYASFAPALKSVFVEAATRELIAADSKLTDSAISVLSGVHRRDIRLLGRRAAADTQPWTPSVASQVFTRWLTDAQLRDSNDRPMPLPKAGDRLSFDALARQVSSDVHPATLLAEMQRLGLVQLDGERVRLDAQAFVPQEGFDDMAALFSSNVADHLAAAAHNMNGAEHKFLEQSVFASGLSKRSVKSLGALARRLWSTAFQQMAREATQHYQHDRTEARVPMRMRFGVYYYAEPEEVSLPSAAHAARHSTPL